MSRKFLYSPGYGAGWSSWNASTVEMERLFLFDKDIIDFIESGGQFSRDDDKQLHPLLKSLRDKVIALDPSLHACFWGASTLKVAVIPDDEHFVIDEYDGNESYRTSAVWF